MTIATTQKEPPRITTTTLKEPLRITTIGMSNDLLREIRKVAAARVLRGESGSVSATIRELTRRGLDALSREEGGA